MVIRKKLLITEDSRLIRIELRRMLESYGFEVLELDNADDFFSLAHRFIDISLLILDINLPGTDGLTALERMRQNKLLAAIPVMILTGCAESIVVRRALQAGAVDFIIKPFSRELLFERIARVVNPLDVPERNLNITAGCLEQIRREINRARRGNSIFSLLRIQNPRMPNEDDLPALIALRDQVEAILRDIDFIFIDKKHDFLLVLPFTPPANVIIVVEKIYKTVFFSKISQIMYAYVSFPNDGDDEQLLLEQLGKKSFTGFGIIR